MKRKLAIAAIVTSLAALCGLPAWADEGSQTPGGKRVRITAPGFASRPVVGNLIAIEATKVTVQPAGSSETVAILRNAVTQFEISSKRSQKGRGAAIGALVGAGVGAAFGFAAGDDCGPPDERRLDCILPQKTVALGGGIIGGGLGAIIGLIVAPGEQWETADPAGLEITVTPVMGRGGGLGLTLSLKF